jgi:hypothetical protein
MNDLDKSGDETLVPDPRVADRYGVCIRTLRRWEKTPSLAFPQKYSIGQRGYRRLGDLRRWERARAAGTNSRTR